MNSSCQQAVYFIAEIVLKSRFVARFKLYRGLTATYSEFGNKNIPLSVDRNCMKTNKHVSENNKHENACYYLQVYRTKKDF